MVYQRDNFDSSTQRNLDFLVKALGLDEIYERLDDLDGKGALPEPAPFNPTNDPMVKPDDTYKEASLSSGPKEWNVGDLSVIDPDHIKKIERLAEIHEAEKKDREEAAREDKDPRSDAEVEEDEEEKEETDGNATLADLLNKK